MFSQTRRSQAHGQAVISKLLREHESCDLGSGQRNENDRATNLGKSCVLLRIFTKLFRVTLQYSMAVHSRAPFCAAKRADIHPRGPCATAHVAACTIHNQNLGTCWTDQDPQSCEAHSIHAYNQHGNDSLHGALVATPHKSSPLRALGNFLLCV